MKILQFFVFCLCIISVNTVSAYGSSSSSKKACSKPKFSDFTPRHLSEVLPGSEFSFTASSATLPESIQVTIKNKPVAINVSKKNNQYLVTGTLPDNIAGTHARISLQASGPKKCIGKDGWLIKISSE